MNKNARALPLYALSFLSGFCMGIAAVGELFRENEDMTAKKRGKTLEKETKLGKVQRREQLYDNWMMAKKYGTPMEELLLQKGWHRVAIYGVQQLGIRLYHELKDTPIEVVCSFDRNPKHIMYGVPHFKKPDKAAAPPVDGVIVSNFIMYDEIQDVLKEAGYTDVIALDELVFQMMEDRQKKLGSEESR